MALATEPHNSAALYYKGVSLLRQGPEHRVDAIKAFTAARDAVDGSNMLMQVQSRVMLAEALWSNARA